MELDLGTVVPSIAGPKRPQDRILLSEAKSQFEKDILNYAAYAGKPHARWSELLEVIPDMREESILQVDTVKLGIFQGFETIKYIEDIEALYQAFCTLAP